MLSFGFIGDGGQAQKIKGIINRKIQDANFILYDRYHSLQSWLEIMDTNAVFIVSPNNTHYNYLKKLNNCKYDGYIYCEKPGINNFNNLSLFKYLNHSRVFFGFNLRYSDIPSVLKEISHRHDLGPRVKLDVNVSYPFVLQNHYTKSWKSSSDNCPIGVLENLGIHYLDFAIETQGVPVSTSSHLRILDQNSSTYDWVQINMVFDDASVATLCCSYAIAYRNEVRFTFMNGEILIDDQGVTLIFPRKSFDTNGYSIRPPSHGIDSRNFNDFFGESLVSCIHFFLSYVKRGIDLPTRDFQKSSFSIQTMLNSFKIESL